jgi:hypothetical protein
MMLDQTALHMILQEAGMILNKKRSTLILI